MPNEIFDEKYRKRWTCGALLAFMTGSTIAIFANSLRLYLKWYRTSHSLYRANDILIHTCLLIGTCVPLCAMLGFIVGTLHYKRKRSQYGKYDVRMRKQGRGYWIDPTDADNKTKEQHAREVNKDLKGCAGPTRKPQMPVLTQQAHQKTMLNPMNWGLGHHAKTDEEAVPPHLTAPSAFTGPGRVSILNPYGWHHQKADTTKPYIVPQTPNVPKPAVLRSDSIRTCDNNETTKKAVHSICLTKDKIKESAKRGYEGREKRKENWEDDVEKELEEVGGSGWWWEGKGKRKD